MNRRRRLCVAWGAAVAALLLAGFLRATEEGEIARLAAVMHWKQGTVVADVGAGDGRFSFAAVKEVGPRG